MLDTVNTKAQHYTDGGYRVGSGDEVIILLGSCRIMPFANYLNRLNTDNRFTIFVIYVVNFTVDANDNPTDCEAQIERLRDNQVFREMVYRCKWFIHEHVENYHLLNTSRESPMSIFRLGMAPVLNICIPNWNDHFILENDYLDCGVPLPDNYIQRGESEIEKFCRVCELSSFPEFAEIFRFRWRGIRYFWRPNHASAAFTLDIWALLNGKFLKLGVPNEAWEAMQKEDLFKDPHTEPTQRDIDGYGLRW